MKRFKQSIACSDWYYRGKNMKLSKQTILVTGGNSGIGLNLIKQLHPMDNTLVVISRSKTNWSQLSRYKPKITTLQCDLSKKEEIEKLINTLDEKAIKPEILINCAAIQLTSHLTEESFSFSGIEKEINTNFTSVVSLSYLLLPLLLSKEKSLIVNITSGLALFPKTGSAVYCATKAALHSFSQSLLYQLENTPLKVTEVLLPLVDTPMTKGRGKGKISAEFAAQKIIHGIEQGRDEVLIGKVRLLPILARLWPGLAKGILRKY